MQVITRKEPGRVIPLRPLPQPPDKSAPGHNIFSPPFRKDVIAASLHALQNCRQTIGMGIELVHLTEPFDPQEYDRIQHNVGRAGRLALELREYCYPPPLKLSTANLAEAIEDAVQDAVREWERPGRSTRLVCHAPLSAFPLDWQQFGRAVKRTVSCAFALLPAQGGEVIVESNVRRIGAQRCVDVRVRNCGEAPLSADEKALFCPFAVINDHALGLSLVLVQQTVARLQGQCFFHKANARQGCFTLLFRT
jgi:hypothetical protein